MTELVSHIGLQTLVRWAAALTLADSYMSLVYHRRGISTWDTASTPSAEDWERAMHKARAASEEARAILKTLGVDDHAVACEMDRLSWMPQVSVTVEPTP